LLTLCLIAGLSMATMRSGLGHVLLYLPGLAAELRSLDPGTQLFVRQAFYNASCFVWWVFLPLLHEWFFPSGMHDPFSLGIRASRKHWPIYGLALAGMLPLVALACARAEFYNFYPMYDPRTWRDWLAYEAVYLPQFFAVEFFFRGYALRRVGRDLGIRAVGIVMIPYVLIHINKPLPEALGSCFAGLFLGSLAYRGKSIWPGLLMHVSVALTADILALVYSGRWANLWRDFW